ncbi:MAG: UDP-N-acetylmuramoyl-tripeptide--D-alanyl-D-alanine ligase [Gemmatimonadales bacterium]
MIPTAAWVREALGLPPRDEAESAPFASISTDTRTLAPGSLFVALQGERYDAHDHLAAAALAGARAAVVRRGTPPVAGLELLEVDDTLAAYGLLARHRRRQIRGPVVAVTGSNGKTSTKEMVAAVLRTGFNVHATRYNLNNLVGIPQTILAAPDDTEALVIEAGANQVGELARARAIIEPTIGIIINVVECHLEGFGSLAGVMQEKLSLIDRVPLAVVGTEPPELAGRARERAGRVLTAGLRGADVEPASLTLDGDARPGFTIDGTTVRLPLRGAHQAGNAMFAWALVRELMLDRAAAGRALEGLTIPGGRGELIQTGRLTVLHDAYNANPQSFRTAMATAQAMRSGRRLVFVAGTMRELGEDSGRLHEAVARELVALEPELLAGVGEFAGALAPYRDRLGERLLLAPDPASLGPALASRLRGDELVVLKASRGVALETILPALTARAG